MSRPRILLVSAYDAISHRLWRQQLEHMVDEVTWTPLLGPARHFAWSLRGRPLQWWLDPKVQATVQGPFDALVATSTVDLAAMLACFPQLSRLRKLVYMHESQFVYPPSQKKQEHLRQPHRVDACMVQLYTMLASDLLVFNSAYHQASMCSGVQAFLGKMPLDPSPAPILDLVRRGQVLSVPIEDGGWRLGAARSKQASSSPLVIAWNHRWEYDKAPDRFLTALARLAEHGVEFRLILLGEFGERHPVHAQILSDFGHLVLHAGMLESREDYFRQLARADVVVSTALHDFQGLSLLEAASCGLWPLAPRRLAYPEIYPASCLYDSFPKDPVRDAHALFEALVALDRRRKREGLDPQLPRQAAAKFLPAALGPNYRKLVQRLLAMPSL